MSAPENPKEKFGQTKPQLHLVPPTFEVYVADAFRDGARKYGPYNWRDNAVVASTYVSAARRHLASWFDGEELAEDSGVHHLAHAAACLAILVDCIETGNLVDDRPPAGTTAALIKRLTHTDKPDQWAGAPELYLYPPVDEANQVALKRDINRPVWADQLANGKNVVDL